MAERSSPQLQKLRTYKDDFARAGGGSAPTSDKAPAPAPIAPAVADTKPAEPATTSAIEPVRPRIPTAQPPVKNARIPLPPQPKAAPKQVQKATPTPPPDAKPVPVPAPASVLSSDATRAIKDDLAKVRAVKQSSILSSGDDVFDVAQAHAASGEATIVTDTKRTRFKLFPAIAAAFKDWLFEKKEDFEERQKPKFTVAPGSTRSAVVQKAAEGGALAPKSDYERVASRLRHVPRTSEPAATVIKKAGEMPAPTWTHTDEAVEQEPVVPEPPQAPIETPTPIPTPPPVEETPAPQAPAPAAQTPEQTAPRVPAPMPVPEPVHEPEPVPELESEPEQEAEAEVQEQTRDLPVPPAIPQGRTTPPPAPEQIPESAQEPQAPRQTSAANVSRSQYRFQPTAPTSPYPYIIAAVVAVMLGVFAAFWFFGGTEAPVASRTEDVSAIGAPSTAQVPLSPAPTEFLQDLASAALSTSQSSITELVPTVTEAGGARRAEVGEVLGVLQMRAPGTFVRGISSIGFGSYQTAEPFIVLELSSFDTALGGMLAWESAMSADLAPLFGAPVTDTFDPLGSEQRERGAYFIDTVYENRDVRVLYDAEGDERIAYTFLDRTTILIAGDRASLNAIAPLIH